LVIARDELELQIEGVDHHDGGGFGAPANVDLETCIPASLGDRDRIIHYEPDTIVARTGARRDQLSPDAEAQQATAIVETRPALRAATKRVAVERAGRGHYRSIH
jgi:hypothetical protein